MKPLTFIFLLFSFVVKGTAEFCLDDNLDYYTTPLKIPLYLSGGFGELRPDHFHSGIDIKTQGVIGKKVYAVADGYLSRIKISPWGYGNALYLTHPNGTTSVYAHLNRFCFRFDSLKRFYQYKKSDFAIDQSFGKEEFVVKKGECIAFSGNTGSSGGPHLHFELRETNTEKVFDALPIYKDKIVDTRAPRCRSILIKPIFNQGVVNGEMTPKIIRLRKNKKGQILFPKIFAWGRIALSASVYDYMNATHNIYGVHLVTLKVDGRKVFESLIDKFTFEQTRYVNSLVEYRFWKEHKVHYMRCYRAPGNKLPFYKVCYEDGYLTINSEREYLIELSFEDDYGNVQTLKFSILGRKSKIPKKKRDVIKILAFGEAYHFEKDGVRMELSSDAVYDSVPFTYAIRNSKECCSPVYAIGKNYYPIHSACSLMIRLDSVIEDLPMRCYYIADIQKEKKNYLGGKFYGTQLCTKVNSFGNFAICVDTIPPRIKSCSWEENIRKGQVRFFLKEDETAIKKITAYIDGQWVLFERDAKGFITCNLRKEKVTSHQEHYLNLEVVDKCGNKSIFDKTFNF